MSAVAYLLDYHMNPAIIDALLAMEPSIRIEIVGRGEAPPPRTKDPELLEYADRNSLSLVTFDKTTMPDHINARLSSGHHTKGVFIFPDDWLSPGPIADALLFVWAASTAEEWVDQIGWLPL